jgi:hypothetical protein
MQTSIASPQSSNRRSFRVTLLAVAVLSIAGWNLLRLVLTIRQWQFLSAYTELSPLYLALSGLIWFVGGTWVGIALWCTKQWAARAVQILSLGYALYFWADRLWLHHAPIQENWFFPTALTLFGLVYTFWATRQK